MPAKYDADIPDGHATQETRNMNSKDQILRNAGFRVHSRPKDGEPIWERSGQRYTAGVALEMAKREGFR